MAATVKAPIFFGSLGAVDKKILTALEDLGFEKCKPAFLAGFRSEAVQRAVDTRRATENPGGVLDSTSRSLRERNAEDMVLCDAAVETL